MRFLGRSTSNASLRAMDLLAQKSTPKFRSAALNTLGPRALPVPQAVGLHLTFGFETLEGVAPNGAAAFVDPGDLRRQRCHRAHARDPGVRPCRERPSTASCGVRCAARSGPCSTTIEQQVLTMRCGAHSICSARSSNTGPDLAAHRAAHDAVDRDTPSRHGRTPGLARARTMASLTS